jgi:hypothetical protein
MLAQRLAEIHSSYGVYPEELLQNANRSIISDINMISELAYLAHFFNQYQSAYLSRCKSSSPELAELKGAARSIDLPFVGPDVVTSGKAKYMFVFEGSLQKANILSMTVLSCFWLIKDDKNYDAQMLRYWERLNTYHRIKRELGITLEIAKQSYVVDSFRIGNKNGNRDTTRNRKLLDEEVKLLKPDLVILVGSTAREIVGTRMIKTDDKYFAVPFPADAVPTKTRESAPALYRQLRDTIELHESFA